MKALRKLVDNLKPTFTRGGKLGFLASTFGSFETFLFVPNHTTKSGAHIRDCNDMKRTMIVVVLALLPAMLFGCYNTGLQVNLEGWTAFFYGLVRFLPMLATSYIVGLAIEFVAAQLRGHEVNEGKEVFGGTGMNVFNPAVLARAFVFFAYTPQMSGETVWYSTWKMFGATDATTGATALEQLATNGSMQWSALDAFLGFIPGSFGETSTLAILIGAAILLFTGIASWKTMVSVFAGGAVMAYFFSLLGCFEFPAYYHLLVGGFAFGAVFMATDPVTSAQTSTGKYIVGFLTGAIAILIRQVNPAYPEGMMLSILFMNALAPLVDYFVVEANIRRRANRVKTVK